MRAQLKNLNNPVLTGAFAGAEDSLGAFIQPGARNSGLRAGPIFKFSDAVSPSDAAVSACRRCLALADVKPERIDFVISCTQTPDFNNPGLVSSLLHKLGGLSCPGIELRQMSSAPLYALDLAEKLIRSKQARQILVSCTDLLSRYFAGYEKHHDLSDEVRAAWEICADGAAAFLVVDQEVSQYRQNSDSFFIYKGGSVGGADTGREVFCCKLPAAAQFPMRITADDVRAGRHFPQLSVAHFRSELAQVRLPFRFEGATCAVTHEVFAGMSEDICRKLGVSNLNFYDVFPKRGHVGAAGVPLALAALPRMRKGDVVMLAVVGAGISWGSAMLEVV